MDNKPEINNEISLKELLEKAQLWYYYLLKQWKVIVLAGIIGASLGLTYSFVKKPVYKASLSFALEDEKGGGLSSLSFASTLGIDLGGNGGGIFSSSNLTELFKSRAMVEKTLLTPVNVNGKVISLAEMYIQNNEWRKKWNDDTKFKNIQFLPDTNRKYFTREHDSILGVIYKKLINESLLIDIKEKKTSIISMDISSTHELFSLYFCEGLAKEVGKFYVDNKSKKARMNMEILKRQTDSIRGALNSAITGVAIATDNTFMLNPALNVRKTPSARRQVDVQANTAILTELVKQTELAKVAVRKETPLIQVIDRPILPLEKEKVGKLKGILVGGILIGFLAVLFLIIKKTFNNIAG